MIVIMDRNKPPTTRKEKRSKRPKEHKNDFFTKSASPSHSPRPGVKGKT
jgi:hypothetical protein